MDMPGCTGVKVRELLAWNLFSLSTIWDLGIKLRLTSLAPSTFTLCLTGPVLIIFKQMAMFRSFLRLDDGPSRFRAFSPRSHLLMDT